MEAGAEEAGDKAGADDERENNVQSEKPAEAYQGIPRVSQNPGQRAEGTRRPNVVVNEKQINNDPTPTRELRANPNQAGTRRLVGERPRRAAEESEHVVVRGEKGGLVIHSSRVYAGDTGDVLPSPVWQDTREHFGDPPEVFDNEGDAVMCLGEQQEDEGGKPFLRALKFLIKSHRLKMIALFEPKVSGDHANLICKQIGFSDWIRVEAIGFSGGIWIFWEDSLRVTVSFTHPQFVLLQVWESSQPPWWLAAVYGSPTHHLRRRLWQDLRQSTRGIVGPWIAAGDFNSVLSKDETSNYSSFSSRRCSDFAYWILEEGLIDMGFSGPNLTWVKDGNTNNTKGARLDRALCSADWRMRFPEASVSHLARFSSDHAPILVCLDGSKNRRKAAPFAFQAAWLTHADIRNVVARTWEEGKGVMANTGTLAKTLSTWNKDVFGNVFKRKKILASRISGIQRCLAENHHKGLIKLELKLRKELETTLQQEELIWFQKSREDWICSGDRNTAFYHAATAIRKARAPVRALLDENGEWITQDEALKRHVRLFYKQLFTEDTERTIPVQYYANFPRLRPIDWAVFNRSVSKEEVHAALKDMKPFKAPGPDGFQAGFYQHMWDKTGDDVFSLVKQAFATGTLQEGLNDTLVALIPKVQSPETVKQFRPISLCNVAYKIITKTITNRLKLILPQIVGPFQSSFVPGRQITDNILIFQEVMHTMREKKGETGYMAIKLDLEKAYDRLSWDFIRDTLDKTGFTGTLKELMMTCIQTPRLSLIWNGERLEAFRPERGIRQGDAMSPAIFVLCMERLSQMIVMNREKKVWKGIKIAKNGPTLTHLCFADDMVLFTEASMEQANVILECLEQFCQASGQKISLSKSQVFFSKNTSRQKVDDISRRLGIERTTNLGKYLGVPAIHGRVTSATHSDLLARISGRLDGWKAKTLSLAGRVVLARSVLNAMPAYTMQTTYLPKGVCLEIEKRTRKFVWGSSDADRKMNLVNWNLVTTATEAGGLGIKRMCELNMAYMAKLGWRLLAEKDSLWAQTINVKYRKSEDIHDLRQGRRKVSNAWRGIAAAWPAMHQGVSCVARSGASTRFWMDKWISTEPLYDQLLAPIPLPELYGMVRDYWDETRGWKWELLEHALPQEEIRNLAGKVLTSAEIQDELGWSMEINGKFTVRSMYQALVGDHRNAPDGMWRRIWRMKVPARVSMFLWLLRHKKLLTNVERAKRKLTADPFCFLCAGKVEDLQHLFRECPAAKGIWEASLPRRVNAQLNGLAWEQWLEMNLEGDVRRGFDENWQARFGAILWWIWRWRNEGIFNHNIQPFEVKLGWLAKYDVEIKEAFKKRLNPGTGVITAANEQVGWTKPSRGWHKLNVDGSCKGDGMAGCGGLIRDEAGEYCAGFSSSVGRCQVLEAEAWGVFHGLRLAREEGCAKLLVESDSKQLIDKLRKKDKASSKVCNIMWRCMREADRLQQVEYVHVRREGNKVADWLARSAIATQVGYRGFKEAPIEIEELLQQDKMGATFHRNL
ncbi:PREDICTED: uncharacterized protein LOC109169412 [Ipomoea nil]|uniref:uncharacterized protein LOC109169412 n=1 Tax=Ipomoea nil TaxID=35883 RepID=UPI000900F0E4|nr:PREDICTED: uncharacterized protein LOC109169412 [Ipomoea nil]